MPTGSSRRRALTFAALATVAGCAASPALRAARDGDWARLRTAVSAERAHGAMDPSEAQDLAEAVASREIRNAPAGDAVRRIDEVRACAKRLEDALDARASRPDEAGAAALTALFEAGLESRKRLARHAADGAPEFRAAGARALVTSDDGTLRRRLIADPDERVRIAALRASADAGDAGDASAVVEAARLDPNALARTLGARAAGAIGGEATVLALHDLWPLADEPLRQAIVDAWGMPRAIDVGGRRELVRIAESEHGAPAIEAGAVLVRRGGEGSGSGLAAVLRGVSDGLPRDRVLAIESVPLESPDALAAVRKASQETEGSVRAAALGRLADSAPDRAAALDALARMAGSGSASAVDRSGSTFAVDRLARAHDARALPLLAARAGSAGASDRLSAARALVEYGDFGRAADLLADADPSVRTSTACAILSSSRH